MTSYPRRVRALAGLLMIATTGCHVIVDTETTHPGRVTHVRHADQPIARRPTIIITDGGKLRFVEPLACPSENITEQLQATEIATRPNLATFVVGVILTSAGALTTVRGALDSNDGLVALGIAGAVPGLVLAVAPWLGLHTDTRPGAALSPVHLAGPDEPCGERAVAATSATLTANGVEIYGGVGSDGTFEISPYQVLDAFQLSEVHAWEVTAVLDGVGGGQRRSLSTIIEGGTLAKSAPSFLAHADFDSKIEPLRVVPGVQALPPIAKLVDTADGAAVKVRLAVHNAGPGDAYALRGAITSSQSAIDGRILYIGHVARDQDAARELLIPLSPMTAVALRGKLVDLSIELRDATGTAPSTPFRFRGVLE